MRDDRPELNKKWFIDSIFKCKKKEDGGDNKKTATESKRVWGMMGQ